MYMYVRLGVLVFVWGFKRPAKTANQEPISDKSKFDFIFSNVATFSSAANYRNILFSPIALKLSHNSPNLAFKTFNFGQFGAGKTFCLTGTHTQALFV